MLWIALLTLKLGKAVGHDGLSAEVLLALPQEVRHRLWGLILDSFHSPLSSDSAGALMGTVHVLLIPKVLVPHYLREFRPISVVTTFHKVLAKSPLLTAEYNLAAHSHGQYAGVKGQQCVDLAFTLKLLVEKCTEWSVGMLLCRIDIEKAYDTVSWKGLRRAMALRGIPDDIAIALLRLIARTTLRIRNASLQDAVVRPRRGIKQGSPESTALFSTVLDEAIGLAFDQTSPVQLGDCVLPHHVLAWVDDTFLLANSWDQLVTKLRLLDTILLEFDLKISWQKPASMTVGPLKSDSISCSLPVGHDDAPVDVDIVNDSMHCFGVSLSSTTGGQPSAAMACQKAWKAFFAHKALWSLHVHPAVHLRNLDKLVRPVWSWSAGCWHLTYGQLSDLMIMQHRMLSYGVRNVRLPGEGWLEAHRRRFRDARNMIQEVCVHDDKACWGRKALGFHWRYFGHAVRNEVNTMLQTVLRFRSLLWWHEHRDVHRHPARWFVRRHEDLVFAFARSKGFADAFSMEFVEWAAEKCRVTNYMSLDAALSREAFF